MRQATRVTQINHRDRESEPFYSRPGPGAYGRLFRMNVGITGIAYALPAREVTTADLQRRVAEASGLPLPPGMFEQAAGFRRRRVAADGEYASALALDAATKVLAAPGAAPPDVNLLLFASASRDMVEPATAHVVQAA